jgi:hypothetical protein
MTRLPHRLLLATLLAASSAVAMAQTPAPAAGDASATASSAAGEHHGRKDNKDRAEMRQRMAERHAHHMAELKTALQITSEQESAWNTFAAAMQPPATPPNLAASRAEFQKLTTPERIDLMQKRQAEREAAMKQRADAVKAFYAQLTPEQQKTFDAQTSHFGPHGGGPRGHGRRGPQH